MDISRLKEKPKNRKIITTLVKPENKINEIWPLLKKQIDPLKINYLIVSHTEPDHSGLIKYLIDFNPNIEIVASKVAIKFLEDQIHQPFKSRAVKTGDELNLDNNWFPILYKK